MINGTTGRSIFIYSLVALVILVLANVVLAALHDMPPGGLGSAISLLSGLCIGAAGINPASKPSE